MAFHGNRLPDSGRGSGDHGAEISTIGVSRPVKLEKARKKSDFAQTSERIDLKLGNRTKTMNETKY